MERLPVTYRADRLILSHFGVAFATFALAILLGAWQMTVRSGLEPPFTSPEAYFASVTAHGTIMGYVMPTLFIMGFGYFVSVTSLDRPLPSMRLAWAGFWLIILGVAVVVGLYLGVLSGGFGAVGILPIAAFVAAAIYLTDVRPKVREFRDGSSSGPYGPW